MTWFANLRFLALARRAVRALERIALAQEDALIIARLRYEADFPLRPSREIQLGTMDTEAINRDWRKSRVADEGSELDPDALADYEDSTP